MSGVRQGTLTMENCVLQCETTGVIVRTSAHFTMNMCDLYGSKVSAAPCPDLKTKQNHTHKHKSNQTVNRVRTFWSSPHNFIAKFCVCVCVAHTTLASLFWLWLCHVFRELVWRFTLAVFVVWLVMAFITVRMVSSSR